MEEELFVDCIYCGKQTINSGTKKCDRCWELHNRIDRDFELAKKIIADIELNR